MIDNNDQSTVPIFNVNLNFETCEIYRDVIFVRPKCRICDMIGHQIDESF